MHINPISSVGVLQQGVHPIFFSNILFLLVGELSNLAVEAQKWERIKVEKDGQDYYVFKNPNSDRYLTALGSEKTSDLTITGMIIPYCYPKYKHK